MAGQAGWKSEATWGVPVVVDTFVPVLNSTLNIDVGLMRPAGIRAGRRTKVAGRLGKFTGTGQIRMELPNVSIAALLRHLMGTVVTTGPVGSVYTHTYTPGAALGDSLTLQTGVNDAADTIDPFTAYGVKPTGWELSCSVGEYAMLQFDWSAKNIVEYRTVADGVTTNASAAISSATAAFTQGDVGKPISGTGIAANTTILAVTSATAATLSANATATGSGVTFTIGVALASASYASTLVPFTFVEGAVSLGGSTVASARAVTLRAAKNLKTDRHTLGSMYIREQLEQERFEFSGSITADFENLTDVRRARGGSEAALVLAFNNGTDTLTATANVQITKANPSLSTNGLEEVGIDYEVGHATSDASALTLVLANTEVSAA